jgi:hypothetical protein
MKKLFTTLCTLVLCAVYIRAQQVSKVEFKQGPENTIIVSYKITGAKFNQSFDVSLYVSKDGGGTFHGPLKEVSGGVGKGISGGQHNITWDVFKEVATLDGDITFDVRVQVIEKEIPIRFFAGLAGSVSVPETDYASFGITAGQTGKTGWYIAARFNPAFFKGPADYACNDERITDYNGDGYYVFDDKTLKPQLSITSGLNFLVAKDFYLFAGAGYGTRKYLWHINNYSYPDEKLVSDSYASHEDYEVSGIQLDGGAMLRIGKILVHGCVTNLNLQYMSVAAGIGIEF